MSLNVRTVSYLWAEAAVNGWKRYVMKWTSLLNQTVLTSVSVLNFLPLFFRILPMNYTKAKSYTEVFNKS